MNKSPPSGRSPAWLFLRLAWQNLGRRRPRTALLVLAVAIGAAALLSSLTVQRAVQDSMEQGFARMGADLLIVPRETLVNLTPALLTAEPTAHTLPAELAEEVARLPSVDAVAPQRYFPVSVNTGAHLHDADLIAFDPAHDFTVLPWLPAQLDRPPQRGEVIVGGRREETPGSPILLSGRTLTVVGRLGLTGVGPFDRSFFVTFDTAADIAADSGTAGSGRVSALLVRLKPGATPEQVRFAIARLPDVKVVAGTSVFTSVRQGLTATLSGLTFLTALTLLATALLVGVVFSAILAERRRELGLLLAIGARPCQLMRMILVEAALVTGLGGVCGIGLGIGFLLLFRRSLGYYFETVGVPFLWPTAGTVALLAGSCVAAAAAVGAVGAAIPAWRTSRLEPYDLVRTEGH